MTDNYEYGPGKPMEVQTEGMFIPYIYKQYKNHVGDINSGIYTNNG